MSNPFDQFDAAPAPAGASPVAGSFAPVTPNPAAPGMVAPPSFSGPGAASAEAMKAIGAHSAAQFAQVATDATQAREQDAILANMQNDLTQFTAGPGAGNMVYFKKLVDGYTPLLNPYATHPIAAQESFDKLANQLVSSANPGSDARQGVLQGATPSSSQSPEGVDFILRQLRGMNDYRLARANLAANAPEAANGNYPAFQARASALLDPRVFQFARLTGPQQQSYLNALPPAEQGAFKKQFNDTRAAGFYGVNNGYGAPAAQ